MPTWKKSIVKTGSTRAGTSRNLPIPQATAVFIKRIRPKPQGEIKFRKENHPESLRQNPHAFLRASGTHNPRQAGFL